MVDVGSDIFMDGVITYWRTWIVIVRLARGNVSARIPKALFNHIFIGTFDPGNPDGSLEGLAKF